MMNLKSIECNPNGCGTVFTIPSYLNSNAHEHFEECIKRGWEYKEALVEKLGSTTIIKCPKCGKEAIKYWH